MLFEIQEHCVNRVGQTPWSARVPLDPLFAPREVLAARDKPARGPAADQGVRPTIYPGVR